MNKYYYLIVATSKITLTSRFFVIMVPNTKQGERDGLFLQRWAADTKNYWSIRNHESSQFLNHIAESLKTRISLLPIKRINARCLVDFIKTNKDVPDTSEVSRPAAQLRKILYPSACFQRQINVIRKAEAEKRNKPKSIMIEDKGRKNLLEIDSSADGQCI